MSDDLILDPPTLQGLLDTDVPLSVRTESLQKLSARAGRSGEARKAVEQVLERAARAGDAARLAARLAETEELLELLGDGPQRAALYMGPAGRRAHVLFSDNTEARVVVPDEELAASLRRGDTVWVEAQGRAVIERLACGSEVGQIARIERRIDERRVLVSLEEAGRAVWRLSEDLAHALEHGVLSEGSEVIGCPVRRFAFSAVSGERGASRYRFLEQRAPPAVDLERDLGAAHPFISAAADHVEVEMCMPDLHRSFGLSRSRAVLLTGAPGTGKTYSILALWRRLYEIMSEVTGVPIPDLPPRVLRMRPARVLSMWLGQSDKNIDRLMDEARMLADELFEGPDGRKHRLPVLLIGEEIEGLARKRGEDATHDRIQTTLLERFEASAEEWRDRLVLFVFTTNLPKLVDPAMFRRAGGVSVHLSGLDRHAFAAVLEKQLAKRRLRTALGADPEEARRTLVEELTTWVFAPGADDPGQIEIHLLGQPVPIVKHRRDLMTAALVQRAVEAASQVACRSARHGDPDPGLDQASLARALHAQVSALVEHLDPSNVGLYVDFGRDAQVRSVQPIRQPALLAPELELQGTR